MHGPIEQVLADLLVFRMISVLSVVTQHGIVLRYHHMYKIDI
jgi:hypothetical protein